MNDKTFNRFQALIMAQTGWLYISRDNEDLAYLADITNYEFMDCYPIVLSEFIEKSSDYQMAGFKLFVKDNNIGAVQNIFPYIDRG